MNTHFSDTATRKKTTNAYLLRKNNRKNQGGDL